MRPESPITTMFRGEHINAGDIRKKTDAYFSDTVRKNLGEDAEQNWREWFEDEVKRYITRERKNKKEITPGFKQIVLTRVLGQLEALVGSAIAAKKEGKERLNPHLLTKQGMVREMEKAALEAQRAKDDKKIAVIINIDLNDLKALNDNHPRHHEAGDELIKSFGQAVSQSIRPDDRGAHYSGDEFGILLRISFPLNATDDEIQKWVKETVQSIIKRAREKTKRPDGKEQGLSAGYTIIDEDSSENLLKMLVRADAASEVSKILGAIYKMRGTLIASEGCAVNGDRIKETLSEFSESEIAKAKLLRNLKRTLAEIYPNITGEELISAINFIAETMIANGAKMTDDVIEKYAREIKLPASSQK